MLCGELQFENPLVATAVIPKTSAATAEPAMNRFLWLNGIFIPVPWLSLRKSAYSLSKY
jgi:hypothetical protein